MQRELNVYQIDNPFFASIIMKVYINVLRPNKKISVFRITGLEILGRVGTQIFIYLFFSGKKIIFMYFEGHFAFQNAKK